MMLLKYFQIYLFIINTCNIITASVKELPLQKKTYTSSTNRFQNWFGYQSSANGSPYTSSSDAVSLQRETRPPSGPWTYTGPMGLKGEPGFPGLVGVKGDSGLPGFDGIPGIRGDIGLPGLTGRNGTPGANGIPGHPGEKGIPGIKGDIGLPGPTGRDGAPGANGIPGIKGDIGLPGLTGRDGAPGANGIPGIKGDIGLPGPTGRDGAPGTNGIPGRPGEKGIPGIKGDIGLPGPTGRDGAPGANGIPGIKGDIGLPGLPGKDGSPGTNGIPGRSGEKGIPGIKGDIGLPGPTGRDGTPGANGIPGIKGDIGLPGLPGKDGSPGTNGIPGRPGEKGIPGIKGDIGLPGLPGKNGIDGMKGLAGLPGEIGIKGDIGPIGPPGIPGKPGQIGLPGPPGEPGENSKSKRLANGQKWAPAVTCRQLFTDYPELKSAHYWIDPSESDPPNGVLLYCEMESKLTCITPKSAKTEVFHYKGSENEVWFSELSEGLVLDYEIDSLKLRLLQRLSIRARQEIIFHCKNTVAYKDDDKNSRRRGLKLLTWNDIELKPEGSQHLRFEAKEDGCSQHSSNWSKTVIEYNTVKPERLPIIDIAVRDMNESEHESEFRFELGPTCFY